MKHLYLLTTLLFTLLSGNLLAGPDSTVVYVADWKKGDSQRYKVTKTKAEFSNGKQTKDETSSYITSVNVVKATKKAYELDYRHEQSVFSNTPEIPSEVKAVAKKYDTQSIKYKTDLFGAYAGIQNWKELGKSMKAIMNEYTKAKAPADVEGFNKIMQPIIAAYSSKDGLENVFPELHYLHSPYGAAFDLYDTLTYDDNFPNIFGGPAIKATGKLYFTKIGEKENISEMVTEVTLNPEDAKLMIIDFLERMAANITFKNAEEKATREAELKAVAQTMEIDIKDYTTYVYDGSKTWPTKVTFKRERLINVEDKHTVAIDEIIIELQK